ncbi:MAG: putative dehydrogenase [Verrucomicrobia bacterium]|jgi:predicted dehydrogenase|nr:MAG: putative dehydrogenase [Verrucomicrobiota bacterium]
MKFGIIGAGMIAKFHAQAIRGMADGELVSVYGRRPEAAAELGRELGCRAFSDLDQFLADPALEIVTIATPSGAHLEPALAAIRAGKHVIVEKPLEVTTERIDQMIHAARASGVTLSGIFNRRFTPAVVALKRAVDLGRFGKITMADAYVKWYRTQQYYDSGAWRGTWALDGGGAVMNQGIHTVDQLIYLAGDVRSVCASTACLAHTGIEVEDTAVAAVEFVSGALGVIQCSTACWSSTGHPAEVHLCGEKGSVFLADERFRVWDFQDSLPEDEGIREELMQGSQARGVGANDPKAINFLGHQRNFEDVVQAIREGRSPAVDGTEARKAVALINAMYQSARSGGARIQLGE